MTLVVARHLKKAYSLDSGLIARARAFLGARPRRQRTALDDVSFAINAGESVAIVGKNGSGKSTLLKLLSGLGVPSSGELSVSGRVQALLELGTGFHPDFSGRDNLYFSAMLHGLSRQEVTARLDAIVDFAELGSVIDDPLRTYSTGMQMRLAFATATAVEPELLLLDEVLAVGDGFFQMRCYERLDGFVKNGGTLVLVSHDLSASLRLCQRGLWLEAGRLRMDGALGDIAREYRAAIVAYEEARLREQGASQKESASFLLERLRGTGEARIREVRWRNARGVTSVLTRGERCELEIRFVVETPLDALEVGVSIYRADGVVATQLLSALTTGTPRRFERGEHVVTLAFEPLLLGPADYVVSTALLPKVNLRDRGAQVVYDVRSVADAFTVAFDPEIAIELGLVQHPVAWRFKRVEASHDQSA